jgi:hypothetical protein
MAHDIEGSDLDSVDTGVAGGVGIGDGRGYFYVDDDARAVGKALRWAVANDVDRVEILAGVGAADLARRAGLLGEGSPRIEVWAVAGATAVPAEAVPVPTPPTLPPDHWALAGVMTEAGAHPVDDHGVLVAEVAGLEVARVIPSPEGPVIEIGVGQADRELNQLVHSQLDPDTSLRRVIAAVADLRTRHVHHPLTRLARERWLRASLVDQPHLVSAAELSPLVPLRPRLGLRVSEPSACCGRGPGDEPMVVVAMVGIDLDLLPEAADYRQRWNPDAELVLAMPSRDLALNTSLLDRVPRARALAVEGPWSR